MTGRVLLNRATSILIATVLLLTPFTGMLLFAGTSEGEPVAYSGGDLTISAASGHRYWNITDVVTMTGNLVIGAGGVVTVDHGGITFSQTIGQAFTLTIEDGGMLILRNSTLTTELNNIRAFPSLGVYVHSGGTFEAYDSTLKFPGHMVIDNSTLTMWRSTITGFDRGQIDAYCNHTLFPAGAFDDAPVLLFYSATVNLYDSRLDKIYEPPASGANLTGIYDHQYSFATDLGSGDRSAVRYTLDSGMITLPTYQNLTLAGNTNLTSVNTYLSVDFSDNPELHNAMVLLDSSKAYLYGVSVDDTQDPSLPGDRQDAFVTVQSTYEAVVSSKGASDNTTELISDATKSDSVYYSVNKSKVLNFNQFNTGDQTDPITGAILKFQYVTTAEYNGTSYIQWGLAGSSLQNTNIQITQTSVNTTVEYNLYQHGVQSIEDVKELVVQVINNAPDSQSTLQVNKVWIEVTLNPTIYIYGWANVTALDSQNNTVSGAKVTATLQDPSGASIYYPDGVGHAAPSDKVLRYLGTDAAHYYYTGSDGTVSIPYLSEVRNDDRTAYSYYLNVSYTDSSDATTYYANAAVSFERYPNLGNGSMAVDVQARLTNFIFLPDLYVNTGDISFSYDPTAGSEVTATITVHNDHAHAPAANVVVEFYAGDRANGGQLIGTTVISVVPAHGTGVATVTWTPTQIGNFPIYVYVNPAMLISEFDYTNNVASKAITVSIDLGGSDLVIGGSSPYQDLTFYGTLSPATNVVVTTGGRLTFEGAAFSMQQTGDLKVIVNKTGQLRLLNGSIMTSTGSVDLCLFDTARLEVVDSTIAAEVRVLPYGESTMDVLESTVESDLDTPETSSMQLIAVNSTFSGVALTNTSTAVLTNVSIPVLNVQDSASVQHYSWVQATVVDGRGNPVSHALVTIRPMYITGTAPLSGYTGTDGTVTFRALSDTITSSAASSRSIGVYSVNITYASASDGKTYYGSDNNVINVPAYTAGSSLTPGLVTPERSFVLEKLEPPLAPADLAVSNVHFSPTGTAQVGSTVVISADITNNGQSASPDTYVRFYLGDEDTGDLISRSLLSSIPAAGGHTTVTATWTVSIGPGVRAESELITVSVEPVTGETALANNQANATIAVQDSRADVSLSDTIDIKKSTTAVNRSAAGEKVTITAFASTATGIPSAMAVKFNFYAENETGYRTLIGTLTKDVPAGQTVSLSIDWTINVTVGSYLIVVTANEDQTFAESDLSNNEASVAFVVDPPNPAITIDSVGGQHEPGDTIYVSGKVTNKNTSAPIPGAKVSIDLYKDGVKVGTGPFTGTSGSNGVFGIQVHIPDDGPDGQYELRATVTLEGKTGTSSQYTSVKAATEGGAPWWLYLGILAVVAAVILIFSAYLYKYGLGKMVECGECGALIPESSKHCPKCGVEFETGTAKCSKCGAWIAANSATCPECGAKFITEAIEEEEDVYLKNMREQYEAFVDTYREEAKKVLDKKYSDAKFPDWWKKQPTYVTFENWLSQEEEKRKIGGIACPTCGILNPRGSTICHKCGSLLETAKVAAPVAAAPLAGAEEKKPEDKPKPLRRVVRRPVEKKVGAKPEEAPAPEPAPAAEKQAAAPAAPAKPEEAKAAEEKRPEDHKPST